MLFLIGGQWYDYGMKGNIAIVVVRSSWRKTGLFAFLTPSPSVVGTGEFAAILTAGVDLRDPNGLCAKSARSDTDGFRFSLSEVFIPWTEVAGVAWYEGDASSLQRQVGFSISN
jgi:hypothetical protein